MRAKLIIATILILLTKSSFAENLENPEIENITKWFNSKPLKISEQKGKVVLVDFWTYSCINCIRTLPFMNQMQEKYSDKGLVIIGVHSPEFFFEKNSENVEKAIKRFGIKYAIAMDNDMTTWDNFHNRYWPAHYLFNQKGEIVFTHFGEGAYVEMEEKIRNLLDVKEQTKTAIQSENFSNKQTPETYLGNLRLESETNSKKIPLHHFKLTGSWQREDEFISSKNSDKNNLTKLQLNFYAKKVFLVMESAEETEILVKINGKKIAENDSGIDVKNAIVRVKESRLYELVNFEKAHQALLELEVKSSGVKLYAFTFGS